VPKHESGLARRVVSRTPPSFTSFTQDASGNGLAAGDARVTGYELDRVNAVRGPLPPDIEAGRRLWRLEATGRLPLADAPFIGATMHLLYTDSATRSELARISSPESGPVAVLIPIRKNAEWWALAREQRQALVMEGAPHGHLAIGQRYATRIYRRLYHARYLPGSEWDFLTYFEFPADTTAAFKELLAALRDVERNPEWEFVDREVELWMTRL
jgi:chlorite dismutase